MNNKKILIVDDSLVNLHIGLNALKNDFKVTTVPSGEKLFECLPILIPDLILLDIEMPGMDGFEVFQGLKSDPKTASIPVIFVTSSDSLEYEKRCYTMGAADYIRKPYYAPFLNKRVSMHLDLAEMQNKKREYEAKLQNNQKEMSDLQMRLLNTVIDLVERRNEVSGGHVERTRKYVEVLLDVLIKNNIYSDIITSWEKDVVLNSTVLYDVGKISVRDSILLKPDKLEDDEFSAMKNHTLMGVKIIDDIRTEIAANSREADILDYAKEFAGFHHEKWDGTGYPNGLKGYNIPLPGRLMAIVDVYDALITKRAYKKTYTPEEAAEIISHGKGTHFDPVLVDVFLSVTDKFQNIAGAGIPV